MALLQISEPGESTVPHEQKLTVGIDLGTTNALVATVRSSVPEVLADAQGCSLLPSLVHYADDGSRQVGFDAQAHQKSDSLNTIGSVKRLLGVSRDEARQQASAYKFVDDEHMRLSTTQGGNTPIEVSAHIMSELRDRAEQALGGELVAAVITVPASFDIAQRQAMRDAARLAGLTPIGLLNEPTAAAIAYGLQHGAQGHYAVYGLGGGSFDISVLRLNKGVFEVVATCGDSRLGGEDFDELIVRHLVDDARLNQLDHDDRRRLQVTARQTREALSVQDQALFETTLANGEVIQHTVTTQDFDTWASPLVNRTVEIAERTLSDANLKASELKGVLLVGGATRMPLVRRAVTQFFQVEPFADIDPDSVVALGAALQANQLVGNRSPYDDWLVLDVAPLSLGIEASDGEIQPIIPRQSKIPIRRDHELTTYQDGQTTLDLHVVQSKSDLASDSRSIARIQLHDIPPMDAGAARLRVSFRLDADGLLQVTARETNQETEIPVSVKSSSGLQEDEIERMVVQEWERAGIDAAARATHEQKTKLRQRVDALKLALESDDDLLEDDEREAINKQVKRASRVLIMDDLDTLRTANEALAQASEAFLARRMERRVRAALST